MAAERYGASAGEAERPASPPVHAVTRMPKHHFFGYYDKHQWDAPGRYLLGHEVSFIDRPPRPDDEITLGFVDLKKNTIIIFSERSIGKNTL